MFFVILVAHDIFRDEGGLHVFLNMVDGVDKIEVLAYDCNQPYFCSKWSTQYRPSKIPNSSHR